MKNLLTNSKRLLKNKKHYPKFFIVAGLIAGLIAGGYFLIWEKTEKTEAAWATVAFTRAENTTNGFGSWVVPAGVSTAIVACWGGGGAGADASNAGGGGGGGGAFASSTFSVTPGVQYTIYIAAQVNENIDGENTTFGTTTMIVAGGKAGMVDSPYTGGAGGTTADTTCNGGICDVEKIGGTGGTGDTNGDVGGGGGGAGGPHGNGVNGSNGVANSVGGAGGAGNAGSGGAGGAGGDDGQSHGNGWNGTAHADGGGGGGGSDDGDGGGYGGIPGGGGGGADNAGGTESNGASGKCTVTYELGDPSWNTGSDDFRVYATSTLAWSEGPEDLVCSASLTDDNSSAVSCGSGSISANTQYRVQVLLKNSGYASLKMNGIYEIIGHMDVKGGWAGASPTLGLSCQFRDVGFDNGATTCAVAWSGADFGSNDVFITNTDAGDVVIAPGATEGFMYMITTDSSEVPESNQTSYWDTPFICGGDVTGLDDGQTYGTVLVGSQCWMTRNLGASQVATAYDDTLSYGDYYQWGRLYDGHQISTSGTTNVQASNYVPGHSNFIYSFTNWLNPAVETLWQAPSYTNNPCPSGWHVPTGGTVSEWATAMANTPDPNNPGYYLSNCSSNCLNSAASSILKLPAAGYRNYADATLYSQGTYGYYWSSSPDSTLAYYLNFDASFVTPAYNLYRVNGFSVRCVRN